jgi:hypothetical protein
MSNSFQSKESKETNKADWVIFDANDAIPAGRYDEESKTLELIFLQTRNFHHVFRYYDVPPELWLDLRKTSDRKSFYSEKIKGKFNGIGPLNEHGNPARPIYFPNPDSGIMIQPAWNFWQSRPYWFESTAKNKAGQHNQPEAKTPSGSGCSFLFWIIIGSWIVGSLFTIKAIITGHF